MRVSFTGGSSKAPDIKNGVKVPYGAAKRKSRTLRWVLVLIILTSPIIYLAGRIVSEQISPSSYGVVFAQKHTVNLGEAGFVADLCCKEGDLISAGDTLMLVQNEITHGLSEEKPYSLKAPCNGKICSLPVSEGEHYLAAAPLATVTGDEDICILAYAETKSIKYVQPGSSIDVILSSTKRRITCEVVSCITEVAPFDANRKNSFWETSNVGAKVFLKINDNLTAEEAIDGLPVQVFWK